MDLVTHIDQLRHTLTRWRDTRERVALVPTMGNLHAGHMVLVDKARASAERVVVSIFVNPTQFVQGEDYETYPRSLQQDRERLSGKGVDLMFSPDAAQLYPYDTHTATRIEVPALDNMLCGAFRPGHFTGVATVVAKLFHLVQPDVAVFGDKDYQQLLLIRRLVKELFIPVAILSVPTVRESDGLAMSSRNAYLSPEERAIAGQLYAILAKAAKTASSGAAALATIEKQSMATLASCGFRPEYFSFRRADDLGVPGPGHTQLVVLAAAWLGKTRLIDHLEVSLNSLSR